MTGLSLAERAREAASTGFTLGNAVREALGAASVCWIEDGDDRVFDPERADAIADELLDAFEIFVQIAINQQGLDTRSAVPDFELADVIFDAPVMKGVPDGT